MGDLFRPQVQTVNTTPQNTQTFQNLLYQGILNTRRPDTSSPNFGRTAAFTPSNLSRTGAGGTSYIPSPGLDRNVDPYRANSPIGGAGGDIIRRPPTTLPGQTTGPEGVLPFLGRPMQGQAQRRPEGSTVTIGGVTYPTNGGYTQGGRTPDTPQTNPDGSPRTAQPRGLGPDRTMQDLITFLNQIFTGSPTSPPGVGIPELPTYDTAYAGAASMNAPTLGMLTRLPGETDEDFNARSRPFASEQGQFADILSRIQGSAGNDLSPGSIPASTITAPTVSSEGTRTMSADEIVRATSGENSMFANNILPVYNDLFRQTNELTAAAARESAGNLTGSGYANTVGTALNRNNAQQQALLADTLNNLVSQEIQRQQGGAQLASTRNLAQAQGELTASVTSAQLRQAAQQLEQQARASGRSDLLQMAQTLNQRAQFQAQQEQQAALTNAGFSQQANIFNAGEENAANSQYFQAGANRNQRQAELDSTAQNLVYGTNAGISQQNSAALMQLLQMLFGGGAQNTAVTSGGAGAMIPGLAQILTTILMGA